MEPLRIPSAEEALLHKRTGICEQVEYAMREGDVALKHLPWAIQQAIEIEAWAERKSPNGAIWRMASFREWVTANTPKGLGSSYEQLCALLAHEPVALAAVRRAWGTELGEPGNPKSAEQPRNEVGRFTAQSETLCCNVSDDPAGEEIKRGTADYTRARLARDGDPERSKLPPDKQRLAAALTEQVDRGEMRPHAAAKAMGYRKTQTPLSQVQSAWKRATPEEREAISAWIDEQNSPLSGSRFQ